jgi:hypothetical protein
MTTIGNTFLDLIDLYKRMDSTRQIARVIELIAQTNAITDDALVVECNNGTKHLTTVRTGLPAITWGKLYQGISQTKSETAQVEDTTGFAEALSSVDQRLLDIAGKNRSAVRLSEAKAYIEAMSEEISSKIFYGDVASAPEQFIGLAPRFNSTTAANGGQIKLGGGTGSDNTSIWFVTWADDCCHLIYPEGTKAGLDRQDMGRQRVLDGSSNPYYVEEELFRWHIGLSVRDWRQVSRVANIDVSDMRAGTVDIYGLMRSAFWKIKRHRVMGGKMAIYCNADVLEALDAASTPTMSSNVPANSTGTNIRLRREEIDGQEVLSYRGIPVRQCDAILNTESLVA